MKNFGILIVFSLVLLSACKDPSESGTGGTIRTDYDTVTLKISEERNIQVESSDREGIEKPFECKNGSSYVTVSVTDNSLLITADEAGTTDLTLVNSFGGEDTLTVRVVEPDTYDTGEIYLRYITDFTRICDDDDSGGTHDISIYEPEVPEGWHVLGHIYDGDYDGLPSDYWVMAVKAHPGSDALAPPVGYNHVWGQDGWWSFWEPVPPAGYKAMGLVAAKPYNTEPDLNAVVCVREDLTRPTTEKSWVYDDHNTGWSGWITLYTVSLPSTPPDPGYLYIYAKSFSVASNFSGFENGTPEDVQNVLHLPVVINEEYNKDGLKPSLESYDDPGERTAKNFGLSVLLPFHYVSDSDPAYGTGWKLENSPFYRLRREDYYNKVGFLDNQDGSVEETITKSTTVGIGASKSTTFSTETSIQISVSGGIKAIGGSYEVSMTQTFGYSSSSSTSWSQMETVSKPITAPPGKCAIMWNMATGFALDRWYNGAWQPVAYSHDNADYTAFDIGIDSYKKSEYPRD